MKTIFVFLKKNFPLLLVLLFQIPLILPFFHKGFFPSHDDVQVVRVFEMYQSLRFGDIPPRWSANLLFGHGYPLYIFYSPLPYFIGALFSFIVPNFLIATKFVFILSFIIGPVGIYFLTKEWWGKLPALISAVAFSYAPYRAVDVFVRGNLGEFFSFSFFPVVFWINLKLLRIFNQKNRNCWRLIFIFALFLLEISHNISCFIFLLFLGIYNLYFIFFETEKKLRLKTVVYLLGIVFFSLILSSFYLVPLLYESKFVLVGQFRDSPYSQYFLTLKKLWDSSWGWGGYTDKTDAVSLQLGKTLIIFSLLASIFNYFIKKPGRKLIIFFTLNLFFFVFMEIGASDFIWSRLTILHFFQFPWRLHILTTLFLSILCGSFIYLINVTFCRKKKNCTLVLVLSIFIIVLFITENLKLFKPRIYSDAPAVSETTTWDDEYLPKWVKIKPKDYTGEKIKFVEGKGKIVNEEWGYLTKKFVVDGKSANSTIEIAHVYYPGWEVYINKKKGEINYDNNYGLMRVTVPEGKNNIEFVFKRTPWRLASELVSIVGVVIFLYWCFSELHKSLISNNKTCN